MAQISAWGGIFCTIGLLPLGTIPPYREDVIEISLNVVRLCRISNCLVVNFRMQFQDRHALDPLLSRCWDGLMYRVHENVKELPYWY